MMLRTRMFLSILLVSLLTLFISSYYLINQSHMNNIAREQERSLNEYSFLKSSLENGIDFNTGDENLANLLSRYAQYYAERGIHLIVYRNKKPLFTDVADIIINDELINLTDDDYHIQVITAENKHYFFVSSTIEDDPDLILIYAREISKIYTARLQSILLSLVLVGVFLILLTFLSYRFSKWITRPLEVLNAGAASISDGAYSIRIPDRQDEFQALGNAFNQMASAVELRTTQLEDKSKELQVFIDDLSHEMNTPLTSIQGYSEFLLNANTSEEQKRKAAEVICQEAKRMKGIYTKLMDMTFFREHAAELAPTSIDDLFLELRDTFSLQLASQQVELIIQNSLATLSLDRSMIYILLSNLIKNSSQALPAGGVITLSGYHNGENAILEVSDNGYGIPNDKISEVMKPFYRVDKSRSRKTGGAGLGLSLCKSIAQQHHAELTIESEEGMGTSVKIIFYNFDTTSL